MPNFQLAQWRPPRLAQREARPGEPTLLSRRVYAGIFAVGFVTALGTFSFRKTALGAAVFSAATSAAGIGLTFFLIDLFGARPE